MGKHFALTLQLPRYQSERKNKPNTLTLENHNYGLLIVAVAGFLVLAYLVQVNSFSTKGYEIRNAQKKIDQLRNDQRALEVQSAELQSLQRIQSQPAVLNMVPVSSISYVQTTSLSQR
jgi:cell division protein FtsL